MQYEVRAMGRNAITSIMVEAPSEAEARAQVAVMSVKPLSVRVADRGMAPRVHTGIECGVQVVHRAEEAVRQRNRDSASRNAALRRTGRREQLQQRHQS